MRKKIGALSLLVFALLMLVLTAACSQTAKADPDIVGGLILETEYGYTFSNYDWWTEQDVITSKVKNGVFVEELDRYDVETKIDGEIYRTFYTFQDGLFCAGRYNLTTESKEAARAFLDKIKTQAETYLTHPPVSGSWDDLTFDRNGTMTWDGKNYNSFRINVICQTVSKTEYIVDLSVSAPMPER